MFLSSILCYSKVCCSASSPDFSYDSKVQFYFKLDYPDIIEQNLLPSFEVFKVFILCVHVIIQTKVHKELITLPQQKKDGITVLELVFSALLLKHSFYLLDY